MPVSSRKRRIAASDDEAEEPIRVKQQPSSNPLAATARSQATTVETTIVEGSAPSTSLPAQLEDLRPAPLDKGQGPNLRRMLNDFKYQQDAIAKTIELLLETADHTAEAFRHDKNAELLKQADEDLRQLLDLQVNKAARKRALEEMLQDLEGGVEIANPVERYNTAVQGQMDAYNRKTARQKYSKNEHYHNFRDMWWSATEEGAMPPVRDLIPAENGDEADSDDEIVAGGVTQNFRCPITTNLLEDPWTNTACKHSYSGAAILEFIQTNNTCPAASCVARVTRSTIGPDPQLKKKVAAFKRREEERQLARRNTSQILD
ncbi:hypothetical protein BCV70DRAFT_239622 [Testicularia cyperi]|uniref:SP-RING-type domain-containing protein n=1 Tax=Testicularia cyperi TaxID=1882483 RepID=A0A317XHN2_9BASI|nr:hypothetical protein BCV70DRAFT_239622 [Testicularia cyperi]